MEVQTAMENQTTALESYQNLFDSFQKNDLGLPIYPDEYGGACIEDGKLVILLTNVNDIIKQEYIEKCKNEEKIVFRLVTYSLNDFDEYVLDVKEAMRGENGEDIIGCSTDGGEKRTSRK